MTNSLLQEFKIAASLAIPFLASSIFACGAAIADESHFSVTAAGEGVKKELPKLATAKEYFARALEENNNKDYASATKDYSEAIRLNPHYGEAVANRGSSEYNNGDIESALRDFTEAAKIFPTNKAILDLKAMTENTIKERANNQTGASEQARRTAAANQVRAQMMLGGDFSDPSTMLMMNAQRRGLISPPALDYSDPASIIMMNAKRRGLVPQNTPNP